MMEQTRDTSLSRRIQYGLYLTVVVFGLALIFSFWKIWQAQAAVTEAIIIDNAPTNGTNKVKLGGNIVPIVFSLTAGNGERLVSTTFKVINVSGLTKSDFNSSSAAYAGIGVNLFRDDNPSNDQFDATDTNLGYLSADQINIGATTTLDVDSLIGVEGFQSELIPSSTATSGAWNYGLVFYMSTSTVEGDSFRVQFLNTDETFKLDTGTVTSAGVTSSIITVDTTTPTSTSVIPTNGVNQIPPDTMIQAVYSETLRTISFTGGNAFTTGTTGTVQLQALSGNTQGGTATGTNFCTAVTYSSNTTTIGCTHAMLATSTWYRFIVTSTVTDVALNMLTVKASSTFRTGSFSASSNTTPPLIVSTLPMGGTQDFPTNGNLLVEFPKNDSGNMAIIGSGSVTSTSNIILQAVTNGAPAGTNICAAGCELSWDSTNRKLKVDPTANLTASTNYALTIKSTTANQSGVFMGNMDFVIFFKTGSGADSSAPMFTSITPAQNSLNAKLNTADILIRFNKDIDPATVTYATTSALLFYDNNGNGVLNNGEAIAASNVSLRYDSMQKAIHFGLKSILGADKDICAQAGTGLTDTLSPGTAVTTTVTKCFATTATAYSATSPTVMFADADNFKVWVAFDQPIDPTTAGTIGNYTIESPVGTSLNLTNAAVNYRAEANGVEITGLGMVNGQQFKVTVTGVKDLSGNATIVANGTGNVAQGMVQNSSNTGGFLGGADKPDFNQQTNFATFWQNPQRCTPNSSVAGKVTRFMCEFPAPASLATGAQVILTLPTGFTIGSTTLPTAANSLMNADLNGQGGPGITTISAMTTNTVANTITITLAHSGTAMTSNDQLRFELDNVYNPSASGSYSATIIIKDASGVKQGQTINSAPFSIGAGGALSISGKVCKGNTDGNACGGSDTGLEGIKIMLNGMGSGNQEATTNGTGAYSFTSLSAGQYNVMVMVDSDVASDIGGGNNFQSITVTSTVASGVDFKKSDLSSTGKSITFSISGGPASTDMSIFCFSPNNTSFSTPIPKKVTTNGSGVVSAAIKVTANAIYQCGIRPYIPFNSLTSGGTPPLPDFTFVPPQPKMVNVTTTDQTITFPLSVAGKQIIGKVVDGSAGAIGSVYVDARPSGCFDTDGSIKDCQGSFAQSKTDGTFTLKVTTGTYQMSACAPGMPCSEPTEVSVKGDTGNVATDNNSTADIYVGGNLVTSATGITVKMLKSDVTISGQVLDENGSALKYAFVNAQKVGSTDTCTSFTPQGGGVGSPSDSSGNYTLYVSNGTWRVEAYAGTYGQVNCTIVTVSSGTSQSSQNLQATASSYGTIAGTVTKNSSSTQGAQVNCYGSAGRNQTTSNSNGTYSIKVKAGTYTCDGFIPGAGPLTPVTGVVVSSGGSATADLSMGNPGTITITLGSTITDAFCDARDSNGRGNGTGQNNNGTYTINVPAGTYTVRCGNPRTGEIGSQSVTVSAGGSNTVTFTAPTLYTVSGRVTDGTNNLEGAGVTFADKTNGRMIFKQTDATAGSSVNTSIQLPAGTYSVVAAKSGYVDSSDAQSLVVSAATSFTTRSLTKSNASISFTVQADSANYTGSARVVATRTTDNKVVATDVDNTVTSGANVSLPLIDGSWSVVGYGDNGKRSSAVSITVSGGSRTDGGSSTLSLGTAITGFTATQAQQHAVVPATGGLFRDSNIGAGFELSFPSGALSTSDSTNGTVETVTDPTLAISTPGKTFLGKAAISITPKNSSGQKISELSSSATIRIPYTESDIPAGVDENDLLCAVWSDATGEWETLATTVDAVNNVLICEVTHFSSFGAIAATSGGTASSDTSNTTSNSTGGGGGGSVLVSTIPETSSKSLVINSGAKEVNQREITLTLSANKATQMAISNTADFTGAGYVNYATSYKWTLSEGNGVKTIYVKFRSSDGGTATVTATITLTSQKIDQPKVDTKTTTSPTTPTVKSPVTPTVPQTVTTFRFTRQLGMNSKGTDVVELQKMLRKLGYFTYPSDTGTYGPATRDAVKKFQKANKISQVGTVGPATLKALNSSL